MCPVQCTTKLYLYNVFLFSSYAQEKKIAEEANERESALGQKLDVVCRGETRERK